MRTQLAKMAAYSAHIPSLALPSLDYEFEVTRMRGSETLSGLYEFIVEFYAVGEAATSPGAITADKFVGRNASLAIQAGTQGQEDARDVHGIIREFSNVPYEDSRGHQIYRIRIVPFLGLWNLNVAFRVFTDCSIADIVESLAEDWGVIANIQLNRSYPVRPLRCQYEESDFNFLCRILQEEGIHFYFRNDSNEHQLVVTDTEYGFDELSPKSAQYHYSVTHWNCRYSVHTAKHTVCGFDVLSGDTFQRSESTVVDLGDLPEIEVRRLPLDADNTNHGQHMARVAMERAEGSRETHQGQSVRSDFRVGAVFELDRYPDDDLNRQYLITNVTHGWDRHSGYRNSFECVPYELGKRIRPDSIAARPSVRGPQSAIVTDSTSGSTDGMSVEVRFAWDVDDKYRCWVRIAELAAGNDRGTWFPPQVDDEVIVEYINGDPDRPVVTGCLYNGKNSSFESESHICGIQTEAGSRLIFDDSQDAEKVLLHSNRDVKVYADLGEIVIENGQSCTITISQTGQIKIASNSSIDLDAPVIKASCASMQVNAGYTKYSGVVQCDTLISNAVVSSTYTPGAGNIW